MFRCAILVMLLIISPARAEPIPKESEAAKIEDVWGKLVDEGGGAKVKLDKQKLILTVPAGDRFVFSYKPNNGKLAPHLVKTVKGDFSVTVTLVKHEQPAMGERGDPPVGLGIVLIFDSKNRAGFGRIFPTATHSHMRSFTVSGDASASAAGGGVRPSEQLKPITIRLTRKENSLQNEYSTDGGKNWTTLSRHVANGDSDEVKVGVYAEHTVDHETTAVFEGFAITKPKK